MDGKQLSAQHYSHDTKVDLTNLSIEELKEKYIDNKKTINNYYNEKIRIEMENNKIDDILRKKCHHQWEIVSSCYSDHTVYVCTICNIRS
jgi:hypothetical protein